MRLYLFAHPSEAQALLAYTEAQPRRENWLYECREGLIAISGMGSLAAASTVARLEGTISEVWNLGLCGTLNPNTPIETFQWVASVAAYSTLPSDPPEPTRNLYNRLHPSFTTQEEGWHLVTTPFALHDEEMRSHLANEFDIVDMEGYAVAHAATRLGIPYRLGKIVSDTCSDKGWESIKQRLPALSKRLAILALEETGRLPHRTEGGTLL